MEEQTKPPLQSLLWVQFSPISPHAHVSFLQILVKQSEGPDQDPNERQVPSEHTVPSPQSSLPVQFAPEPASAHFPLSQFLFFDCGCVGFVCVWVCVCACVCVSRQYFHFIASLQVRQQRRQDKLTFVTHSSEALHPPKIGILHTSL